MTTKNWIAQVCRTARTGFELLKIFYRLFVRPKKIWRSPPNCEVLIYDASGSESIIRLIGTHSSVVVPTRGESVNVPLLIKAITNKTFWIRGQTLNTYVAGFATKCHAKLVITFIDNNHEFYSLWKLLPGIQTMMIQNGARNETYDLNFGPNRTHEYRVNYVLSCGIAQSCFYSKFITGRADVIGSIRNNSVAKKVCKLERTVVFISAFERGPENSEFFRTNNGEIVYWDAFYLAETVIFKWLANWSDENNYTLALCGRSQGYESEERQFFQSICRDNQTFTYLPKTSEASGYSNVDNAGIVVTIDSTLGFESLSRGNKTAFFYNRDTTFKLSEKFGWPAVLPESGPFWTNLRSEAEFERVMNSVASATDEEFAKMREPYMDDLMVWDPGNSKAKALIDSILDTNKPAI